MRPLIETYDRITYAQQPPPEQHVIRITDEGWPRFMLFDPLADRYWTRMHAYFPQFQFALYDGDMRVVAICNSVPIVWDGDPETLPPEGWDWAIESGISGYEAGTVPNTLCAISITIAHSHVGRGISPHAVEGLRQTAREAGLTALIAPVRPSLKCMYPLTPMERYMCWQTDEGSPFDPWLRVHWRAGATIIKPCPQSMIITGTVDQWEEWASMIFPETGTYIVPKALSPVEIDVEQDRGTYIEANVWMVHRL